jgi:hypothetical protein
MNILSKIVILNSILLFSAFHIDAMEAETSNIIEGDAFIVPNKPTYADGLLTENEKDQLKLQDNDMMVEIWTTSKESDNWNRHGHPRLKENKFPGYLPYRLLKDKKEGDTLTLSMHGKSFVLRLVQSQYRYSPYGKFEDILRDLKNAFVKRPNYVTIAKANLLAKGILVKKDSGIIHHGPNGFQE